MASHRVSPRRSNVFSEDTCREATAQSSGFLAWFAPMGPGTLPLGLDSTAAFEHGVPLQSLPCAAGRHWLTQTASQAIRAALRTAVICCQAGWGACRAGWDVCLGVP